MIPMKQTVKITGANGLDQWGQPTPGRAQTYNCRIDTRSQLVKTPGGEETVSSADILLKGLVLVGYGNLLEWKDETGRYAKQPLNISVIRDFSGKPLFTKVVV